MGMRLNRVYHLGRKVRHEIDPIRSRPRSYWRIRDYAEMQMRRSLPEERRYHAVARSAEYHEQTFPHWVPPYGLPAVYPLSPHHRPR